MSVHRRLDQILQSKGQVSERQIREALIKQSVVGGRLGEHLIKRGEVRESDLVDALSEQYGLPGVCLERRAIEPELFARIPFAVAEQHRCVPFAYDAVADTLEVAFANPHDRAALRAVSGAAHPTRVKPYVAAAIHVRAALAANRHARDPEPAKSGSSDQMDGLLDLLELAVASGHGNPSQGKVRSAWVAILAVDIADRLGVPPDAKRKLRLAALTSNISEWRRGPVERPRAETLERSIIALRDLDLPWDIVPLLQACIKMTARDGAADIPESILRVAWAVADTMPDGGEDVLLENWESSLRATFGNTLDETIVKTAFVVLRVRSLRRRLGDHPQEIVVIGNSPFADELLALLREMHYRVVNAQFWAEGLVLLERRRPDLVCVIASGLRVPPHLVMEAQIAEHGIDPSSVILIVPKGQEDYSSRSSTGHGMLVIDETAAAAGVLGQIQEMLQTDTSANSANASGRGANSGPAVVGRLADLGLADLVQVLSSGHKTAHVVLSCAHAEGSLWFDRGQIAAARSDRLTGDEAFFDLLNWSDGRFEVHTVGRAPVRNITTQTTALLLEGFRRMDESKRVLKA